MGKKIFALTLLLLLAGVLVVHAIDYQQQATHEKSVEKKTQYINNSVIKKDFKKDIKDENELRTGLSIGEIAPNIKAKALNGKIIDLSSYRGKKVILNFWATWCPPCKSEIPSLVSFYVKQHSDIEIIGINLESPKSQVDQFIKQFNITYPIIMDSNETISNLYQIQPIPTTYYIDEKGVIFNKQIGALTIKDLNKLTN